MISFVIPYHNEPLNMLRQCLDSILSLSLSNEERVIIVVDDGSDYSSTICATFKTTLSTLDKRTAD